MNLENIKSEKFKIFEKSEIILAKFVLGGSGIITENGSQVDYYSTTNGGSGDGNFRPFTESVNDTYKDGYAGLP